MNHLWIAYDALLVMLGMVNLLLLYLARERKQFLVPFIGFYAAFALGLFVALSRRYVSFNVEGAHSTFAFWSYGAGTVLFHLSLSCMVPCYHRMLGWSRPLRTRVLVIALILAGVFGVMPWSVELTPDAQSYSLKWGHYVASLTYFGAFSYVVYVGVIAAIVVNDRRDRLFARVLLIFGAVGYVESTLALITEMRYPVESLSAEHEYFLYSSIPYTLFSAFLATYLLPLVGRSSPSQAAADQAKLAALGLSAREEEVLRLLLTGLSNKGIANELHISEATVKTHLNKIFKKANVRSRFELARELSAAGGGSG